MKKITLENLDKRLKKLEKAQTEKHIVSKYKFEDIFEAQGGLFKAKFDLICNGSIMKAGLYLHKGIDFGGLNWYDHYIGRSLAGTWDDKKKEFTIVGLY